jgi:membrane-associated phospholipid phosphatase
MRLLWGALICVVLLAVGYIALVGTAWGHQLDDKAFFGREAMSRRIIILDARLLFQVTRAVVLLAGALLLLIAAVRRCFFVGVVAVVGFGSAIIGAEFLKDVLPWRALVPADGLLGKGFQIDTYPSGHATVGTAFALGLLLVSPSRWRPWLAVLAGGISSVFATGVIFAGWHRPSDALGALAWSGLCMNLAAAFAVRLKGQPRVAIPDPKQALSGSIAMAILVAAALWSVVTYVASEFLRGYLSFFAFTALIIAGAFSLTAWFGWQLREVDFFKAPGRASPGSV